MPFQQFPNTSVQIGPQKVAHGLGEMCPPQTLEQAPTETPVNGVKLGLFVQGNHTFGSEAVLFNGFDGKKHEYCPYTQTSKDYDGTRAPLGLNIALGSMVLSGKPLHEQRLLDIGCGTGTFLSAMEDKVGFVAGVEYNDGMIEQARARLRYDKEQLLQGSADSLPFPDAAFDVCTMNQVAHHFPKD